MDKALYSYGEFKCLIEESESIWELLRLCSVIEEEQFFLTPAQNSELFRLDQIQRLKIKYSDEKDL